MSNLSSSMNDTKGGFVFVGGGTGGHLYPALAIIEQLNAINPNTKTHIVCSQRRIDAAILQAAGVDFSTVPATSPSGGVAGLIRFASRWGPSVRHIRSVIQQMKNSCDQVTVVAMGGFVSAPLAMAAKSERVPLVLVNLDAVAGKANRWIAKRASRSFTAAEVAGFSDWTRIRPIVRGFDDQSNRSDALAEFGLDSDKHTLLVTGGSQGARSINQFMVELAQQRPRIFEDWQILHQVGDDGEGKEIAASYCKAGVFAVVVDYIERMGLALSIADVAFGRCGAGTVAECWDAGVPAVFWPYPYHKDEHQRHNAAVLVDAGCAVLCTDLIDPERNVKAHGSTMIRFLCDDGFRDQMRASYDGLGRPDGAAAIAKALVDGK